MRRFLDPCRIVLLLASAAVAVVARESSALSPRTDNPSASNFLRRPFPAVIRVGDYVYIDGGEVSSLPPGPELHPSYPVNSTLSISLKSSWTNATVTMNAIRKDGPKLNAQTLWRDPSAPAFYAWGGVTSYFAIPPPNEIWRFTADGAGGGAWETVQPANIVIFNQLVRSSMAATTQSRDVGYWFGGLASPQTDTSVTGDMYLALPGLVSYNMTSGELKNTSTSAFGKYGTLIGGSAQWIPFGKDGLLLFMGGGEGPVSTGWNGWTEMDFNTLTLYDPKADKWYTQQTTGSRPARREKACVVGVQGPNSTYEIFMYGGLSTQVGSTSDEVYVLSLPGFVFFKAPLTHSTKRADHSCVLIGNRQMLSVGGTDGYLGFPGSLTDPDPWRQGLGVLDLTRMQWVDGYSADAPEYESPDVVKQWYNQGGLASVTWASDDVKALFVAPPGEDPPTGGEPSGNGNGGDGRDGGGDSLPPPSSSGSGSVSIGPIVGGVVGGVVALALAIWLAWFLLRRKKSQAAASSAPDGNGPGELAGSSPAAEKWSHPGVSPYYSAVTPEQPPQELPAHVIELPADHGASELLSPHGRQELPLGMARFSWQEEPSPYHTYPR